jgi:hypothetical protein
LITTFAVFKDGSVSTLDHVSLDQLTRLAPYSASNNLIQNEVVLFLSGADDYGSEAELLAEIRAFIHAYHVFGPKLSRL